MTPLVGGTAISAFLTLLTIRHRFLAGVLLVWSMLLTTIYLFFTSLFYGLDIRYQWALAVSFVAL